jgi:glutathione transport system permease protein
MRNYWLRKILAVPLILLVASFLIFWAVRLLPGDPARLMAGMQADQKVVDSVRSRLGLDKPFAIQYEIFLRNVLHGDLGTSIRSHKPVAEEIAERFPYTLALTTVSFALAVAVGTTAGVFAAIFNGRAVDHLVMVTAISGASIANFWLALLAMNLFAV